MGVKTYQENNRVQLSKNFNSYEFRCGIGTPCSCSTILIDDKLIEYLQKIRDHFGKTITITSAYRCPSYNKRIGGTTGSYHSRGQAVDIVVNGVKPAEVAKYAESIGIKGIGLYESSKDGFFVHIDTRAVKSFWYGQAQVYRSTFGGSASSGSTTKVVYNKISVNLPTIMTGSKGEHVRLLQLLLNISIDGDFGVNTENAVKAFQKKNNLKQDGVVGKDTWEKLFK
jgi:hypothetical protein